MTILGIPRTHRIVLGKFVVVFGLRAKTTHFRNQTVIPAKTYSLIFPHDDPNEVNPDLVHHLGDDAMDTLVRCNNLQMNYEHVTEVSTVTDATRDAFVAYSRACQKHEPGHVMPLVETILQGVADRLRMHASALVHMRTVGATGATGIAACKTATEGTCASARKRKAPPDEVDRAHADDSQGPRRGLRVRSETVKKRDLCAQEPDEDSEDEVNDESKEELDDLSIFKTSNSKRAKDVSRAADG